MRNKVLSNILHFIMLVVLIPVLYNVPFYFSYWNAKDYLTTAYERQVIIIYDDFSDSEHGEIVSNIFTSSTDGNYSVLKIDRLKTRIETLGLIVDDLADKDKDIYLNLSMQPTTGLYSSIFASTVDKISKRAIITQSIGNNEYLPFFMSDFMSLEDAKEIDTEIYKILNTRVAEIKIIAEDRDLNFLISRFGTTYGVLFSMFIDSRDDNINVLVKEVVRQVLDKKGYSKYIDKVSELYASDLIKFSYSVLLQKISGNNKNLLLVSSSSQLQTDLEDNVYFLDCKINNLLVNKIRFPGIWTKNDEVYFGTSISSPLALSSIYKRKLNIP